MSGIENSNILVVDDEKSMRDFLEILLTKEGHSVTLADSGETACDLLETECFDLVVTDIIMNEVGGIEVLKKAKAVSPTTVVVLISAYATAETAVQAMKDGAYDYIPKPFKLTDFKRIVREALRSKKSAEGGAGEDVGSHLHFGLIVGESPQMRKVYDLTERVAQTRTNILITGESGTGKELVARAIHGLSPRRDKAIVAISCAGIPENLIESELFGYRKGAFTGATTDKMGLFERADGGTIFLDEVGELTPAIQVKLLRVIQERTFTAVGDTQEKTVDVRFVSATNKDLENEVIYDRFREDLYFRLNVIRIPVPPLREREGDLQLLAQHFIETYSEELKKDVKKISAYAMDILQDYTFPGNVRELENIIERSVTLETSNIVLPESLALSRFRAKPDELLRRKFDIKPEGVDLDEILAEFEKDYLLKALEMSRGNRQRAADLLGLSMRSFRYRLEKAGISAKNV